MAQFTDHEFSLRRLLEKHRQVILMPCMPQCMSVHCGMHSATNIVAYLEFID